MPVCHVQSTPAGLRTPDRYSAAAWPLVCEKQRLPRKVFRRSIAWLSDSLSTLRRAGYPATTQDSLPAAGQALPDGLPTRRVPAKGFRVLPYISSSFPKLCLAQTHRPLDVGSRVNVIDRPPSRQRIWTLRRRKTDALIPIWVHDFP